MSESDQPLPVGEGEPRSVGEALAAADAADSPAGAEEGSTPAQATDGAETGAQQAQGAETPEERKARLQAELADAQADIDTANAERLANASDDEKCPTCGQLPPPADPPAGAREIWCPDCGQKLADLPAGH